MKQIGIGIIGCGGIVLQNHLPGLALCPEAKLTALCDTNPAVLERASRQTGVNAAYQNYPELLAREDVNAVIIATPNFVHAPIALAAIAAGKHVLCEKPIAMNHAESLAMLRAAEQAGVRHMTAFTYRFVPAMHYMSHLAKSGFIGRPYHFRSCRLQDWDTRALGWRQVAKLAGTGELGDMLSHRIDYAHLLIGPIQWLVADTRRVHDTREGQASDLEDWAAILAEFSGDGATGVLESSKIATGRGEGARSQDYCEVNGSEGSLRFQLERPLELQTTKRGESSPRTVPVPDEFLKWPGSPRDPRAGDPLITFRYDQDVEFIHAILEGRPCVPSFAEGVRAQAVMDAAVTSAHEKRWVEVPQSV
ncbi:MAG TPA: Gfo/Idh/MocA family oxidoreductase [Verrucomicrobiae bacterium]|nr:Gfo/Idh/MocA family oxidoreductase [Verrucomicrobiae bacterium]